MGNLFQKIVTKDSFKNDDVQQKELLEDFDHLIIKNNLPIQFVENVNGWLCTFVQELILFLKGFFIINITKIGGKY
jgi:hypothetical protein